MAANIRVIETAPWHPRPGVPGKIIIICVDDYWEARHPMSPIGPWRKSVPSKPLSDFEGKADTALS